MTLNEVAFRPAHQEDASELADLRWMMRQEDGDAPAGVSRDAFRNAYMEHLRSTAQQDWVADLSGRIVGVMSVITVPVPPKPARLADHYGYLTNCFVVKDHRNLGIGSLLLGHVIDWARSIDFELLIVWPSDRARPFYRRMGFTGDSDPWALVLRPEES